MKNYTICYNCEQSLSSAFELSVKSLESQKRIKHYMSEVCPSHIKHIILISDMQYITNMHQVTGDLEFYQCLGGGLPSEYIQHANNYIPVIDRHNQYTVVIGYFDAPTLEATKDIVKEEVNDDGYIQSIEELQIEEIEDEQDQEPLLEPLKENDLLEDENQTYTEKEIKEYQRQIDLQCKICYKSFKVQRNLNLHYINKHKVPETALFHCDNCNMEFATLHKLDWHKLKCMPEKGYKVDTLTQKDVCNIIGDVFKPDIWKRVKCTICGDTFKFKSLLREHMSIQHEINPTEPRTTKSINYSELTLNKPNDTKIHVNIRNIKGKKVRHELVACEDCGKLFKEPWLLKHRVLNHKKILRVHLEYSHELEQKIKDDYASLIQQRWKNSFAPTLVSMVATKKKGMASRGESDMPLLDKQPNANIKRNIPNNEAAARDKDIVPIAQIEDEEMPQLDKQPNPATKRKSSSDISKPINKRRKPSKVVTKNVCHLCNGFYIDYHVHVTRSTVHRKYLENLRENRPLISSTQSHNFIMSDLCVAQFNTPKSPTQSNDKSVNMSLHCDEVIGPAKTACDKLLTPMQSRPSSSTSWNNHSEFDKLFYTKTATSDSLFDKLLGDTPSSSKSTSSAKMEPLALQSSNGGSEINNVKRISIDKLKYPTQGTSKSIDKTLLNLQKPKSFDITEFERFQQSIIDQQIPIVGEQSLEVLRARDKFDALEANEDIMENIKHCKPTYNNIDASEDFSDSDFEANLGDDLLISLEHDEQLNFRQDKLQRKSKIVSQKIKSKFKDLIVPSAPTTERHKILFSCNLCEGFVGNIAYHYKMNHNKTKDKEMLKTSFTAIENSKCKYVIFCKVCSKYFLKIYAHFLDKHSAHINSVIDLMNSINRTTYKIKDNAFICVEVTTQHDARLYYVNTSGVIKTNVVDIIYKCDKCDAYFNDLLIHLNTNINNESHIIHVSKLLKSTAYISTYYLNENNVIIKHRNVLTKTNSNEVDTLGAATGLDNIETMNSSIVAIDTNILLVWKHFETVGALYTCPTCNINYTNYLIHIKDNPLHVFERICKLCPVEISVKNLTIHIIDVHLVNTPRKRLWMVRCGICNLSVHFINNHLLKCHQNIIADYRMNCNIADKKQASEISETSMFPNCTIDEIVEPNKTVANTTSISITDRNRPPLTCLTCKIDFENYLIHIKDNPLHVIEEICRYCPGETSVQNLTLHIIDVHFVRLINAKSHYTKWWVVQCCICNKSFNSIINHLFNCHQSIIVEYYGMNDTQTSEISDTVSVSTLINNPIDEIVEPNKTLAFKGLKAIEPNKTAINISDINNIIVNNDVLSSEMDEPHMDGSVLKTCCTCNIKFNNYLIHIKDNPLHYIEQTCKYCNESVNNIIIHIIDVHCLTRQMYYDYPVFVGEPFARCVLCYGAGKRMCNCHIFIIAEYKIYCNSSITQILETSETGYQILPNTIAFQGLKPILPTKPRVNEVPKTIKMPNNNGRTSILLKKLLVSNTCKSEANKTLLKYNSPHGVKTMVINKAPVSKVLGRIEANQTLLSNNGPKIIGTSIDNKQMKVTPPKLIEPNKTLLNYNCPQGAKTIAPMSKTVLFNYSPKIIGTNDKQQIKVTSPKTIQPSKTLLNNNGSQGAKTIAPMTKTVNAIEANQALLFNNVPKIIGTSDKLQMKVTSPKTIQPNRSLLNNNGSQGTKTIAPITKTVKVIEANQTLLFNNGPKIIGTSDKLQMKVTSPKPIQPNRSLRNNNDSLGVKSIVINEAPVIKALKTAVNQALLTNGSKIIGTSKDDKQEQIQSSCKTYVANPKKVATTILNKDVQNNFVINKKVTTVETCSICWNLYSNYFIHIKDNPLHFKEVRCCYCKKKVRNLLIHLIDIHCIKKYKKYLPDFDNLTNYKWLTCEICKTDYKSLVMHIGCVHADLINDYKMIYPCGVDIDLEISEISLVNQDCKETENTSVNNEITSDCMEIAVNDSEVANISEVTKIVTDFMEDTTEIVQTCYLSNSNVSIGLEEAIDMEEEIGVTQSNYLRLNCRIDPKYGAYAFKKCLFCLQYFQNLYVHYFKHRICTKCEKDIMFEQDIIYHLKKCFQLVNICTICFENFEDNSSLIQHYYTDNEFRRNISKISRYKVCASCNKLMYHACTSETHLCFSKVFHKHLLRHDSTLKYNQILKLSLICHKYIQPGLEEQHYRSFIDKLIYECTECSYKCISSEVASAHLLTHTKHKLSVNLYPCVVCNNYYKLDNYLSHLLEKHATAIVYKCVVCRQFLIEEHYQTHAKTHPNHYCTICKMVYINEDSLIKHLLYVDKSCTICKEPQISYCSYRIHHMSMHNTAFHEFLSETYTLSDQDAYPIEALCTSLHLPSLPLIGVLSDHTDGEIGTLVNPISLKSYMFTENHFNKLLVKHTSEHSTNWFCCVQCGNTFELYITCLEHEKKCIIKTNIPIDCVDHLESHNNTSNNDLNNKASTSSGIITNESPVLMKVPISKVPQKVLTSSKCRSILKNVTEVININVEVGMNDLIVSNEPCDDKVKELSSDYWIEDERILVKNSRIEAPISEIPNILNNCPLDDRHLVIIYDTLNKSVDLDSDERSNEIIYIDDADELSSDMSGMTKASSKIVEIIDKSASIEIEDSDDEINTTEIDKEINTTKVMDNVDELAFVAGGEPNKTVDFDNSGMSSEMEDLELKKSDSTKTVEITKDSQKLYSITATAIVKNGDKSASIEIEDSHVEVSSETNKEFNSSKIMENVDELASVGCGESNKSEDFIKSNSEISLEIKDFKSTKSDSAKTVEIIDSQKLYSAKTTVILKNSDIEIVDSNKSDSTETVQNRLKAADKLDFIQSVSSLDEAIQINHELNSKKKEVIKLPTQVIQYLSESIHHKPVLIEETVNLTVSKLNSLNTVDSANIDINAVNTNLEIVSDSSKQVTEPYAKNDLVNKLQCVIRNILKRPNEQKLSTNSKLPKMDTP